MNLLLTSGVAAVAFISNFVAWYMAGRRTLYVMRLDVRRACILVWFEDLLPYINIGGFLLAPSWPEKIVVAMLAATGGALGIGIAMMVEKAAKRRAEDKQ